MRFSVLSLAGLVGLSRAAQHGLIVANFVSEYLYTVNFDDETLELELVANISVPAPSSWITLNVSAS